MGISVGRRLKAIAIVYVSVAFLLAILAGMMAGRAEASANLTAYRTVPPNSWEPMLYNVTGTAPFFITHTLNWSNTRIAGNLGIGDGSMGTLNALSNREVNYTDNNFMAADISMAPWDPGRITALSAAATAAVNATNATQAPGNETNATSTAANATSAPAVGSGATGHVFNENSSAVNVPGVGDIFLDIPRKVSFDNNTTQAPGNATNETAVEATNQTASNVTVPAGVSFNRALNDPYHPILMGRPVDDLFYEYPTVTSINMYARLVGLRMPSGACANMGIKCLGYGY